MDDLWTRSLKLLRHLFIQAAVHNAPLYHFLVETADHCRGMADGPGRKFKAQTEGEVQAFQSLPWLPQVIRPPTREEIEALKPEGDEVNGHRIIRHPDGRPIAVIEPMRLRWGHFVGDRAAYIRFQKLATGAGGWLLGLPPDLLRRLPKELLPIAQKPSRRLIQLDELIAVAPHEPGPDPVEAWVLALHELAQVPMPGSLLRGYRQTWLEHRGKDGKVKSIHHFPADPDSLQRLFASDADFLADLKAKIKIPPDYFFSALGTADVPEDVHLASVYAIDLIIETGQWRMNRTTAVAPASAATAAAAAVARPGFREWSGGPTATLALVFTDIVDSTALNVEVGDAEMSQIRIAHFARARRLIDATSGYELKTIGDAFMIAFRTATAGLDFMLALKADTGHARVHIRAGIHVGPVSTEERDAFGLMVNYANRVAGCAKAGGLRTSSDAKTHIDQQRLPQHNALRWSKRATKLKGIPQRQTVWSVERVGLSSDGDIPTSRA